MNKYKIVKWDVILSSNGLNPVPIIFIKPDLAFIKFIRNDNYVNVNITGSNSVYDNCRQLGGFANKSSFKSDDLSTNLYVITLDCMWYGYPPITTPGVAEFY